ncbi:hypothetical protein [Haloarchaeobius sp. TZWWS8]|uniref:hypothetical protein n=1 Tax=Haloarchaeobius sp. TZWWS8 TaxID=3446121 RepID=UPI003EBB6B90
MVTIDEQTLESLFKLGRWLTFHDFVRIIEEKHPREGPGVPREVLDAYAAAIVDDLGGFAPFTVEQMEWKLEAHVAADGVWEKSSLFEVGPGRISVFPVHWHARLHDETDPREYVAVMRDDLVSSPDSPASRQRLPRVPKQYLLDAMVILGGLDRREATGIVNDARKRGEVVLYPFQNPDAEVLLR